MYTIVYGSAYNYYAAVSILILTKLKEFYTVPEGQVIEMNHLFVFLWGSE